nr:MAG TPA: hypothetical protein [Caudoviricetes sp.]
MIAVFWMRRRYSCIHVVIKRMKKEVTTCL